MRGIFQQKTTKTQFYVENWSNFVAQHAWTSFNLYLHQLLTQNLFWGGGWNPYLYSAFSNKCKIQRHTKQKKRHYLWTHLRQLLLSKCLFFCIFHFGGFRNFRFFERCFFDRSQKIKKWQNAKAKKNNMKRRCKVKDNLLLWFKTKQDDKQKNRNKGTSWNKKQAKQK